MLYIYGILSISAIVLFGVALYLDIDQKDKKMQHTFFGSNTTELEILLDYDDRKIIQKPVMVSTTLIREEKKGE